MRESSFSSRFFFNNPEISEQIKKKKLNTSLWNPMKILAGFFDSSLISYHPLFHTEFFNKNCFYKKRLKKAKK